MREIAVWVVAGIGALALLLALGFGLKALGLFNIQFWGVKYEDAHRKVYEQTKAYNHGMIRDIENLCLDAQQVESQTHKDVIKATINHRVSAFTGELPSHVKQCLNTL